MSTPTITTKPCPAWCAEPSGHPFVKEPDYPAVFEPERWHRRQIAKLTTDFNRRDTFVLVERLDFPDGGGSEAQVTLAGDIDGALSAVDARALASALIRAAGVLEAAS